MLKMNKIFACVATGLFLAHGAAQAEIQERNLKLSYPVSQSDPIGMAANKLIEIVDQKTQGKFKIKGYSDAQLGNEIQSISSAQGGVIEMTVVSTAGAGGNVKEFGIFDLPFLFNSVEEADALVDGPVGKELLQKLEGKNLVGLCYWDYGFRQVTNSKHPIKKLEDFQGLKIRTLQNRIYIDTFKALGANPLPLPYPETFTALESKAIDGQESAYVVTKSSGFHEAQKYVTETNHVFLPAVVMVSKRFWDRLADDEKQVFNDSCIEAQAYHRQISRDMSKEVEKELVAAGLELDKFDETEKARLVQATNNVTEKYKEELGKELVEKAFAELENIRKK
ncbi:MAG: TRAP transporter substrate-binding protein [Pelistega sp.]|nr:TRAP transporter substrate-binding protein [Pelistega sp.]